MKIINIVILLYVASFSISCGAENDRVEKEKLYPNGKIDEKWQEKNGVKDGYYKYWAKTGELIIVGQYKNGNKDGKWIIYRKNGDKLHETFYKDGLEDGESYYWQDGKIRVITIFKDGVIIKTLRYENGKYVPVPILTPPVALPKNSSVRISGGLMSENGPATGPMVPAKQMPPATTKTPNLPIAQPHTPKTILLFTPLCL